MKIQNFLNSALTLFTVFALTSCSDDETLGNTAVAGADGVVTFTASIPTNIVSRATDGEDSDTPLTSTIYSDGTKATTLYYAIYSVDADDNPTLVTTNYGKSGDDAYVDDAVTFENRKASVTLHLVVGKKYKALFWAQSPDATIYTFDTSAGTITIDTDNLLCNDETMDAFFNCTSFTFGEDTANQVIMLTRPFAQLNVGATDYEYAKSLGFDMQESCLTTVLVYSVLNLFDGTASGLASPTFQYNTTPAKQENAGAFPAKDNGVAIDAEYTAMAYILVGADKSIHEVQYNYSNITGNSLESTNVHKFHNVPLQRNHRTNIYGSVLTAKQTWNVKIDQVYTDDDYNEDAADQKSEDPFWAE